jgi:hypothetical protein
LTLLSAGRGLLHDQNTYRERRTHGLAAKFPLAEHRDRPQTLYGIIGLSKNGSNKRTLAQGAANNIRQFFQFFSPISRLASSPPAILGASTNLRPRPSTGEF